MSRHSNHQSVFYPADYPRPVWEVVVDYVLPPILYSDGRRFDEDYFERFCFHVFGIGGPDACFEQRYQPHALFWCLDVRDAFLLWFQGQRARWAGWVEACASRSGRLSRWLAAKTGWRGLKSWMARTRLGALCMAQDDDMESLQQPFLYDPRQHQYGTFSPQPSSTDPRTPFLLQHAALYSALSSHHTDADFDEPETPIIVPLLASPSPRPERSSPPSALSGKRGFFRIIPMWRTKRSVRFSGVHDVVVYDKLPGEPTGCYKPDYSHLTGLRPDPQLDVIISVLHAVSSASRQTPPPRMAAPPVYHAPRMIACDV